MKIDEKTYNGMPQKLQALFTRLPNHGSDEVLAGFPQTGASKASKRGGTNPNPMDWGNKRADGNIISGHNDNGGSAARFFYCAKASKSERNLGLGEGSGIDKNTHPTVKPLKLMEYLVKLITLPDGIVLDPFAGSGSTLIAAKREGFNYIGIEMEPEYVEIAKCRLQAVKEKEPVDASNKKVSEHEQQTLFEGDNSE